MKTMRYRDPEAQVDRSPNFEVYSLFLNIFFKALYIPSYEYKYTQGKTQVVHMVKCFDTHVKGGDCWYIFDY